MGDREANLPNTAEGHSDGPSGTPLGMLGSIREALTGSLLWLQSPGKHIEGATKVNDGDAMVVDADNVSQRMQGIAKNDSFVTVSTQSSQEYEMCWADFSAEDLEEAAADAERTAAAPAIVPPPISREGSGSSTTSSLGKRPRSGSIDAGSAPKKRTYKVVDDDPFVVPKCVPDERLKVSAAVTIAEPPLNLKKRIEGLAWGVQWEIARLVSAGSVTYPDVAAHLDKLKGSNAEAASKVLPLLRSIVVGDGGEVGPGSVHTAAGAADRSGKSPWSELDSEEKALKDDPSAGLGFSKEYPGWYGGQIQFTAKLKDKGNGNPYKVVLQKPEMGPSNRLARRFGSRRFIRIRVPQSILNSGNTSLAEFSQRPFLLSGHVFRAFSAKEGNIFLVDTTTDLIPEASGVSSGSSSTHTNFSKFLNFHNPIVLNRNQALTKWAARFALGLSNSVPGLVLRPQNIHFIEDIVAPWEGEGKPPPEFIFTDGCGWINAAALRKLQAKIGWDKMPTAVQFRLDGAKGLLLLHPDGKYVADEEPQVWIRPSQIKIHYDANTSPDAARLVIDVLSPARLRYPSRLSAETIVNIAHNQGQESAKERHKALRNLMHEGINEAIQGLVKCFNVTPSVLPNEANQAMPLLWHEVSRAGGVMSLRMAREFTDSARARGFVSRLEEEEEEDEQDATLDQLDRDVRPHGDLSGYPLTLEETAMALLGAGFDPTKSKFLNDKLRFIVKKVVNRYTQRYRIDVPGSAEAFCVPDPKGVLEPGEIYLKTSQPIKGPNGVEVDVLIGDVLVTRHPTKLPTDVQKVRAVHRPELDQYTDVIVFPTKGNRSLASLLAGGDCDGDTVTVIWEASLVHSFVNARVAYADAPDCLDSLFEKATDESVQDLLDRTSSMGPEVLGNELRNVLLAPLRDGSTVGAYSIWHDNAVYSLGYDHMETRRLAFMFCWCLDGAKSGLRVKSDVYKRDKKRWDRRGPLWKEIDEPSSNERPLARGLSLAAFIMDDLKEHGKRLSDSVYQKWNMVAPPETKDEDLLRPWADALSQATVAQESGIPRYNEELQAIAAHVQRVREEFIKAWSQQMSPKARLPTTPSRSRNSRSTNSSFVRVNDEVALSFAKGPRGLLLIKNAEREELKASYAYLLDTRKTPFGNFAFKIAFRELLRIKAEAQGGVPVAPNFYRCFDIQSGVKALSRRAGR